MRAKYQRGRQSVHQYLRMTSIVNPHASISLIVRDRDGSTIEEDEWQRTTDRLPRVVSEIKPHPGWNSTRFSTEDAERSRGEENDILRHNFSGVSMRAAREILAEAGLDEEEPQEDIGDDAQGMINAFRRVKLLSPPTDCLSPLRTY